MRHYLAIFLLIFMPLQLSWAVVASYCQHESASNSTATAHLGHHQHQHQAEDSGYDQSSQKQAESKLNFKFAADPDCAACHAAATPALLQITEFHFQHQTRIRQHDYLWPAHPAPSQGIERPQWFAHA